MKKSRTLLMLLALFFLAFFSAFVCTGCGQRKIDSAVSESEGNKNGDGGSTEIQETTDNANSVELGKIERAVGTNPGDTDYIKVEVTRIVERLVYVTATPTMTPTPSPTSTCTPTPTVNPNPTMCPYEDIVEERLEGHGKFVLDVKNIQQNPELPNGCEGTSVAIVMNYLGIDVDKIDFAVNWIPRGKSRVANPWFEFPGDPRDGTGYGCYMPVVCKALSDYLMENNISGYVVEDLSNTVDLNGLCDLLEDGYPLMVGANGSNKPTTKVYYWQDENGNSVEWRNNNHFLVLVGYDKDKNKLAFADPQKQENIIWYDATEWSYHWQERNRQVGRVMQN